VVSTPDGRVAASVDLLVDGRHFRRDWSTPYDIGRKAAAQNLADIAAMGAVPTALLVGLAAPADLAAFWAERFADGLREECELVGAGVVGGDVVRSEVLLIAVTALGDLQGRAPVTRAGARVGDVVAVAGRLGWSGAGLAALRRGFRSPKVVVDAHRRPEPPYAAGPLAAVAGATAMIDTSDGLVADLGHVATASDAMSSWRWRRRSGSTR
jgi:thiamine-monophosphate kinase